METGPRPQVPGRRLLLCLAAWPLAAGLLVAATILGLRWEARPWLGAHRADLLAILLLEAYLALLGALVVSFGGPRGLATRLGFRFTSLRDLAGAGLAWLLALAAGGLLTGALAPLLGAPKSNAAPILDLSFDPLFVALVVPTTALLAPACEELLFRGALFGWLRGRMPVGLAAVVSAALFGGAHLLPPLFPYLFVFALLAAAVYQRTGSTLNTFAMHAGQNTLAIAATYWALAHGGIPGGVS